MGERTEAQKKAQKKYMERFTIARIRMDKEKYARVQEHSKSTGESVSGFVNRAIDNQIAQDEESQP